MLPTRVIPSNPKRVIRSAIEEAERLLSSFHFAYPESYFKIMLAVDLLQELKLIFEAIMRLNQVPSYR